MKESIVTIAPTIEPISLQEAKDNLKISSASEDIRISGLIVSARKWCEEYTNRSLIKQTRTQYMDCFYNPNQYTVNRDYSAIELLYGPLLDVNGTTVISVKYYDDNDALQTLSASEYWIDDKRKIPRIYAKTSWPTSKARPNAVEIAYWAGYGESGNDVPGYLIDAMHMYITHCFENRVPEISGASIAQFEMGVYRLMDFGVAYQNAF